MKQHYTNFGYKARYFQLGELTEETNNLIFVIHGYGQQAKYFLQKFEVLDNGNNCIVAPEGLSRFYLEGFSGRVGATWMTKEDRLIDIENYISYLNKVYHDITQSITLKNTKLTIIGFSQGSATASRWAGHLPQALDQLILWAGIFPPDLNYELAINQFRNVEIKYVYGVNDPYLSDKRLGEMHNISKKLKVTPETITFNGEHVIDPETLKVIFP